LEAPVRRLASPLGDRGPQGSKRREPRQGVPAGAGPSPVAQAAARLDSRSAQGRRSRLELVLGVDLGLDGLVLVGKLLGLLHHALDLLLAQAAAGLRGGSQAGRRSMSTAGRAAAARHTHVRARARTRLGRPQNQTTAVRQGVTHPFSAVMVIFSFLPVPLSSAATLRMPLASTSNVTSIWGAGGQGGQFVKG
jgi:hypothetical protein